MSANMSIVDWCVQEAERRRRKTEVELRDGLIHAHSYMVFLQGRLNVWQNKHRQAEEEIERLRGRLAAQAIQDWLRVFVRSCYWLKAGDRTLPVLVWDV